MSQIKLMDEGRMTAFAGPENSGPIDLLIVDDEPVIRRLLELALRACGLRVRTADSGAAALRLVEQHGGNVRLVLLDVQMPQMDGPQTLAGLRDIAPELAVVFMSGGLGTHSVEELMELGAIDFIEKPFRNLQHTTAYLRELATAQSEHVR
jgi:two-component system cell cycle sensor histidine kinase/response regulator CckA